MRITFHPTFDDYYEAATLRGKKLSTVGRVGLLAISAGVVVAWALRLVETLYLLLAFGLLIAIPGIDWLHEFSLRRVFTKAALNGEHKEIALNISGEGLEEQSSGAKADWKHFSEYSESPRVFVLYRKDTIEAIFPKSAFDAGGLLAFQELLRANLRRRRSW